MRNLALVTVLTLLSSTGCFLRNGPLPGLFGQVMGVPAGGATVASGTTSNVTVNGQPATASVSVGPRGVGMAVVAPGTSMSATVATP
jgi:hypothetical protein